MHAQAERFLHTDFTVVAYEAYIELAERLGADLTAKDAVEAAELLKTKFAA